MSNVERKPIIDLSELWEEAQDRIEERRAIEGPSEAWYFEFGTFTKPLTR